LVETYKLFIMLHSEIGFLSQQDKFDLGLIDHNITSRPIDREVADELIDNYVNNSSTRDPHTGTILSRNPVLLETKDGKAIDGFYFPIDHVITLLKKVGKIDGIYLAIGQYSPLETTSENSPGRTLILYGVKEDGTVHDVDQEIFDYSEPCPCKCPKGKNGHNCP